jgi:hypothetical protein
MGNDKEDLNDIISDELLEKLNKSQNPQYNQDLGTTKDPYYSSYKEFLDEQDKSIILKIDPKDITKE